MSTLEDICYECHNYFEVGKKAGYFNVTDGNIDVDFLQDGQYFRVIGSVFNDGIYQYPATDMTEEAFIGEIWAMAVPKAVLELVEEIDAWKEKYGVALTSPYNSESFGGYSYSKGNGYTGNANGTPAWLNVFSDRIKRWYKLWA